MAAFDPVGARRQDKGAPMVEAYGDFAADLGVDTGDAGALANAICRMLGSPELRRQLASAGRAWVLDRFSSERMVERTQNFYLESCPAFTLRPVGALVPGPHETR